MLFAAKCYWPGVTETQLEKLAVRVLQAGAPGDRSTVAFLGSLLFSADELVLCLFEASSRADVKRAAEIAAIPVERVMSCAWLAAQKSGSTADDPDPEAWNNQ